MIGAVRVLAARIRGFVGKKALEADFDAELQAHLDLATDAYIARGLGPRAARRQARIDLGSMASARALHRAARGLPVIDALARDVRTGAYALRREPGFALISTFILGVGIGLAATVFAVMRAILLEPLPFDRPDELVWIAHAPDVTNPGLSDVSPGAYLFEAWQAQTTSFESLSAYNAFFAFDSYTMRIGDVSARITGVETARDLLDVLGVRPVLGTGFAAGDDDPDAPPSAILSHHLWRTRFQANADVVGLAVTIDERPVVVRGVLPEAFDFAAVFAPGTRVDFLMPLVMEEARELGNTLGVVGRLHPHVTVERAHRELVTVTERIRAEWARRGITIDGARALPLRQAVSGPTRRVLWMLLAGAGLVIAIVSINLANLQLARSVSRRKELAVRSALGAGTTRMVMQITVESMMLVGAGSMLGLTITFVATRAIARLHDVSLPLLYRVTLDLQTVGFATSIAVLIGVLAGLLPALRIAPGRMRADLEASGRGRATRRLAMRLRNGLVVAQTALACVLLIASGLLARSLLKVLDVDLGFEPVHAYAVTVDGGRLARPPDARHRQLSALASAARAVPGVSAAGITDALPLDRDRSWWIWAPDQTYEAGSYPTAFVSRIGSGYFEAMGIALQAGRTFDARDRADRARVVIVSQAAASRLYPRADAVGRLALVEGEPHTIVGVVADVRHKRIESAGSLEIYLPMAQAGASHVSLVARSDGAPSFATDLRTALRRVDPTLPFDDLRPLSWLVERAVSPRRFLTTLSSAFAGFAWILAALGLYGTLSYTTGQRTREIGIRLALGASPARVRRDVLRDTARLAGSGIVLGILAALVASRALRSMLFGVPPTDRLTYALAVGAAIAIAAVAGAIPAARAARTEPRFVLHHV